MARASTNKTPKKRISKINLTLTSSQRLVMGSFLIIIGILLLLRFSPTYSLGKMIKVL